jgi:hypothetical protein
MQMRKPVLWLNKTIKTGDDFQFVLMVAFIAVIIFAKCYMLISPHKFAVKSHKQKTELVKVIAFFYLYINYLN